MLLTASPGFARVDMLLDEARSNVAGVEDHAGRCVATLTAVAKVA